jgi:hypothetical protein
MRKFAFETTAVAYGVWYAFSRIMWRGLVASFKGKGWVAIVVIVYHLPELLRGIRVGLQ